MVAGTAGRGGASGCECKSSRRPRPGHRRRMTELRGTSCDCHTHCNLGGGHIEVRRRQESWGASSAQQTLVECPPAPDVVLDLGFRCEQHRRGPALGSSCGRVLSGVTSTQVDARGSSGDCRCTEEHTVRGRSRRGRGQGGPGWLLGGDGGWRVRTSSAKVWGGVPKIARAEVLGQPILWCILLCLFGFAF